MSEKKVEVTPPQALLEQLGSAPPAGTRLELMQEFVVKPNGRWCLVRTEGVPWPGYEADGSPEEEESQEAPTGKFKDNFMAARSEAGSY